VSDIFKIFRQYVTKRQRRRPEWRKTKYVLSKHIQTNIFDQVNYLLEVFYFFCISRPEEDHSLDQKFLSKYFLIKYILFPSTKVSALCLCSLCMYVCMYVCIYLSIYLSIYLNILSRYLIQYHSHHKLLSQNCVYIHMHFDTWM